MRVAPRNSAAKQSIFLLMLAALCTCPVASAQTTTSRSTPPRAASTALDPMRYKGIWEPVSFNADVKLFDVFFTAPDEGWVAGGTTEMRGGIILHTTDGGTHWDVAYGDPQSSDRGVHHLRFLDPVRGWAIQDTGSTSRLLHTSDGQTWVMAGTIPEHTTDYMFTSDTTGVALKAGHILQTADGGRSWRQVAECVTTVQVQGLARNLGCEWARLQFLTPYVAYAIGFNRQARNLAFLARTADGGATWTLATGTLTDIPQDGFFLNETTGYIRAGAPDTGQIFKTTDGGQTWTGMAASPGARIQFADPEVGWAVLYNKVSFTTDGGNRWNSRQYSFPARVNAFSLPRRDRGYVVGEHGMIYRYRIVPENYNSSGMIPAPLLSGIDSPLDNQVQQLAKQIQTIAGDAGAPPMTFTQDVAAGGAPDGLSSDPNMAATAASAPSGTNGTAPTGTSFSSGMGSSYPATSGGISAGGSFSGTIPGCPGVSAIAGGMNAVGGNARGFTQNVGTASSATVTSTGFTQDTGTSTGTPAGMSATFVQNTNVASNTANLVADTVPQFISRYRNLNLLMTGFQVATLMPATASCLKQSLQALKHGKDPQSIMLAITNIQRQVGGLVQMTRMAFQRR